MCIWDTPPEDHVIRRERSYTDDSTFFVIRGEYVDADPSEDVELPIPSAPGGEYYNPVNAGDAGYPACPDCGGDLVWAEAGRVPGSRDCISCGSQFADMRWHA